MTDSAPSPWAHDRRICTGDWVRLAGDSPSLRSVGKVVDGDYDTADHTLRAACVDMGTRTYWVPPAELVRLLPEDEVRLCELALERGVVDPERDPSRVDRLQRALASLREGTTRYVRTPGLLDVLWGGSIHADPDHGSRAIAGFLDEALDVLAKARAAPRRLAARRVSDEDDGVTIRELLAAEARARAEATAREREAAARRATDSNEAEERARNFAARVAPPRRPDANNPPTLAAPCEVLPRILHVLNNTPLVEVLRARGLTVPSNRYGTAKKALVSTILSNGVPLSAVLDVLSLNQLRQGCAAVGMQGVIEGDPAILRQRLLALGQWGSGARPSS